MKKQNASHPGVSRRTFIRTTAAGAAGISVVPRHVLGGAKFVAPSASAGGNAAKFAITFRG